MTAYFYCPQCGYYETIDPISDDIRTDVEHHCGDCNSVMITQCSNPLCTEVFIETLDNKFHPCGVKLPNIEKAKQRLDNSDFATKRPF